MRVARLVSEFPDGAPELDKGDRLELRLPDGRVMAAAVGGWGIDGYQDGDYVVMTCNPADPEFTLSTMSRGGALAALGEWFGVRRSR